MKLILLSGVLSVVALAVAAPTYSDGEQQYMNQQQIEDFLRERRSLYGPQFVTPCAAASPVQVPTFAAPIATPYQGYATVPQYGYAAAVPHYRSNEDNADPETLSFSDMDRFITKEHVPMARGYGAVAPVHSGFGGQVLTQGSGGPALGVFPNAHVGRCSVPLLFSCSPTIVPGSIVESQSHYGPLESQGHYSHIESSSQYAPAHVADAYRIVDEPVHHDQHEELLTHEHLVNSSHESSHVTP